MMAKLGYSLVIGYLGLAGLAETHFNGGSYGKVQKWFS